MTACRDSRRNASDWSLATVICVSAETDSSAVADKLRDAPYRLKILSFELVSFLRGLIEFDKNV